MLFHRILALSAVFAVAVAGCLQPQSSRCGDLYCPAGSVCSPNHDRCVSAASLSACAGHADGDPCVVAGAANGECHGGVCAMVICGNGVVETGEVCDDGNTVSCDGCSADCKSDESCGNGIIDCHEQCDDGAGNSTASNAACRPDCTRQRCGDGIVDDRAGEECDSAPPTKENCSTFGFYGGTLGCSPACRAETSMCAGECGDGVVNGPELCDGAPPPGQSCIDYGYDVGSLRCSRICTPSFLGCDRMGWNPTNLQTSAYLEALWGSAQNDVYAVGDNGVVLHFDGTQWKPLNVNTTTTILGVWGMDAKHIWMALTDGSVQYYDGTTWTHQTSPINGSLYGLWSVWASATNNAWGGGDGGNLIHWDGSKWSSVQNPFSNTQSIFSLWGTSASDIWAVGDGPTVIHYNGSRWASVSTPAPAGSSIYWVWGTSATNVWAVGKAGLVMHYDGTAWSIVPSGVTAPNLISVWGSSANDVYVVGDLGTILHWDGNSFTQMVTNQTETLFGVWGSSPDDVWVDGPGLILHFGGGPTMEQITSPTTNSLEYAWGSGPNDVYAVGDAATILHWNGSAWSTQSNGMSTSYNYWGVWGSGPNDVFAVGDGGNIYHSTGTGTWTSMQSKTSMYLNAVYGFAPNDVYAVGGNGVFIHYDGSKWSPITTPNTTDMIYSLWGTATNDVWMAVAKAKLWHWDGTKVTEFPTGGISDVWQVVGASAKDAIAFADTDGAYHWNGTDWQHMTVAGGQVVDNASGTGTTDLFVIDWGAVQVFHYDGIDFAPIRSLPASTPYYGVWMGKTNGYLVGARGQITRIDRNCTPSEKSCHNRWDDDCDGLTNCADPDCTSDPYCMQGGLCSTLTTITCGATVNGTNIGGTPTLERYGCSPRLENGRELYYRYDAQTSGSVTVDLTTAGADLDLVVLGTTATTGCDPLGACVGASSTTNANESVTFTAEAGKSYYFVVDGYQNAIGDFSLAVGCQ